LSTKIEKHGTELIIQLIGRLDMSSSISDGEAVEKSLTDDITGVMFDLKQLHYLSSAGLRILIATAKEMHTKKGSIKVKNCSSSIHKVLEIADFFSLCTE
jgi:anti-sigma B factor antagonist